MSYIPPLYNPYGQPQPFSWSQPVGFTSVSPQNDVVKKLGEEYRSLPKEERLMMKSRILNVIGSM